MKHILPALAFAMSALCSSSALAWSPFDVVEPSIERLQSCFYPVSESCPEGATCNEYGEVICGPGEVCEDEEPDCE